MTNIPFPNPHDADALNDYLDELAAGKQVTPESDVETAASAFHQLASRAEVNTQTQQPRKQARGEETMHTATLTAPVSNRTRRQMAAAEKNSGRSYGWLSAVIVAGLMISMIGSAWMNREPENPNENLAFAPGTATAISEDDVLTPETSPWIADFNPEDCTETSEIQQVQIAYVDVAPQGYEPIGPAAPDAAADAASQYREMRACPTFAGAWAYWSEARIQEHPRVFDETASMEITELQEQFAGVYPEQFMVVADDLSVSSDVKTEWNARLEADQLGLPIPLDAKLNPEWGVELGDGRIAFPATIMYSAQDPALVANGLPIDTPASTIAMIFTQEDGSWKYDDSLQLCLMNCTTGVDSPMNWEDAPTQASAFAAECSLEEMSAGEYRNRTSSVPDFPNRSYQPAGTPESTTAEDVVASFDEFGNCSSTMDALTIYPLFTDLGLFRWSALTAPESQHHPALAPTLREGDRGAANIVATTPQWHQLDVVDSPVHRVTVSGVTPERWWESNRTNEPYTWPTVNYVNPNRAVMLEDGRIAITTTTLLSAEDRGAVLYEGDSTMSPMPVVIYEEQDGRWLIDEVIQVPRHVGQISPSEAWWWDEQYNPDLLVWTQPVSFNECPDDAERNVYDPENPGGTMYSQEDYDQVSSERSYEIVGPANPEDANGVVTRMREAQGCIYMGKSTLGVTARFEYENRTTAGRESVEEIADERSTGAESISNWLDTELGLTYQDLIVYQDQDELTLDGTESVVNSTLFNPEMAVEFADGRVGIVPNIVTYEPIEEQWDVDSVEGVEVHMTIFVYQDGEWMLDENLPVCIGDCSDLPDATPMAGIDPYATPEATPQSVEPTPTNVPRSGDNRG